MFRCSSSRSLLNYSDCGKLSWQQELVLVVSVLFEERSGFMAAHKNRLLCPKASKHVSGFIFNGPEFISAVARQPTRSGVIYSNIL